MCAAGLDQQHPPSAQVHKQHNLNHHPSRNGTHNGQPSSSASSSESTRHPTQSSLEHVGGYELGDAPSSNSSTASSSSTTSSSSATSTSQLRTTMTKEMLQPHDSGGPSSGPPETGTAPTTAHRRPKLVRRQTSLSEVGWHATTGSLASAAVLLFSCYFPFFLAPWAATRTYQPAWYQYDPLRSVFCNSIWTYGTDYFLAAAMAVLASRIASHTPASRTLALRSRGLLLCYCCSVLAGGVAHQYYTTLEDRNTWHFRFLWTICVGSVTVASAWMGCLGTELARIDRTADGGAAATRGIPILPEWFWAAYGTCATLACAAGSMSFQRPACDIFIAGITQFPSTFYVMLLLGVGLPTVPVPKWARIMGLIGFILNAPLLPMYPLLVQYTSWSTASINTLLHTWLLTAWGLQGFCLRRVEQALAQHAQVPPRAVPVPRSCSTSGNSSSGTKSSSRNKQD